MRHPQGETPAGRHEVLLSARAPRPWGAHRSLGGLLVAIALVWASAVVILVAIVLAAARSSGERGDVVATVLEGAVPLACALALAVYGGRLHRRERATWRDAMRATGLVGSVSIRESGPRGSLAELRLLVTPAEGAAYELVQEVFLTPAEEAALTVGARVELRVDRADRTNVRPA